MKKILIITCLLASSVSSIWAQQQINFTQYMFDLTTINPAAMGLEKNLSISAFSRWQWSGIEGAPNTQTLSIHSPANIHHVALGFQFVRDEIGVTSNSYAVPRASYKVKLGHGHLHMGLQAGLQIFSNDLQDAYVLPSSQDDFNENFTKILPTVGYGFHYYRRNFYVGFSSPFAVENSIKVKDEELYTQRQQYYLTSGVQLKASDEIEIKPSVLVRAVSGTPVSIDYNLIFLYNETIWAGFSYRAPESISFLTEIKVHPNFRFGYAYDFIIEPTLSSVTSSTHEIMINYRHDVVVKKFD
ncbi:MAG: type IX secretion system membrane protein PorP/SprF [Ekhidna sp.]